jgi:hypothetical protein
MLTYRKTRDGAWAVFGPQAECDGPGPYTVTKKDGTTKQELVVRVSKPFDIEGVAHVYGFLDTPAHRQGPSVRRRSSTCLCTERGCCRPTCYCNSMCACKGGPVYDCLG